MPKGAYAPDIIVLLTDGVSNAGPLPLDAAQQAADRGVRVYTIGFGTADGSSFPPCGRSSWAASQGTVSVLAEADSLAGAEGSLVAGSWRRRISPGN